MDDSRHSTHKLMGGFAVQTDMASSPGEHGEAEKDAEVPSGVLDGLDDLEEGRTLSDEEFEDVLKF
ncbi:hypothetical protein GCM10009066_05410 [Halarchaeum salinum]|uniref:Uncharacterized protein n=1 Tax=Halarchaeum salinum TaxID=489912 RepID=A0AAV3S653_9EURY